MRQKYAHSCYGRDLRPSSEELTRLSDGDNSAFEDVLVRWEGPIERIAFRYTGRPVDVDDLQQVGRIALYKAMKGYRKALGKFENYANRAIRLAVIRESTKLNEQRGPNLATVDSNPEAIESLRSLSDEIGQSVCDWIATLDSKSRTIYQLLYELNMTQREAAAVINKSQTHVRQANRRLLASGYQHFMN